MAASDAYKPIIAIITFSTAAEPILSRHIAFDEDIMARVGYTNRRHSTMPRVGGSR